MCGFLKEEKEYFQRLFTFVSGRKKVEVLLQQMFQGEIDEEDEGPMDMDDIDNYRKKRRLTLEEVT